MNVHIALYRWNYMVSEDEVRKILVKVEALASKVPGILEISTGKNTSKYNEGYTHVILVRGQDQAAIDAYRKHPDHIKVAKRIDAMEDHAIGIDFSTK